MPQHASLVPSQAPKHSPGQPTPCGPVHRNQELFKPRVWTEEAGGWGSFPEQLQSAAGGGGGGGGTAFLLRRSGGGHSLPTETVFVYLRSLHILHARDNNWSLSWHVTPTLDPEAVLTKPGSLHVWVAPLLF